MNRTNVTRLLTYLEQLKAGGEEDKWDMTQYLSDRRHHESLFPEDVTNWHCGTAGCLAGSWAILKVKDGGVPPETTSDIVREFGDDFGLTYIRRCEVTNGHWSANSIRATLDDAIAYLRLCLSEDSMDVKLG
jgi:hypothetical protein